MQAVLVREELLYDVIFDLINNHNILNKHVTIWNLEIALESNIYE